jgi:predicted AlkP superfamily phosphohydrolase/phosphomutase
MKTIIVGLDAFDPKLFEALHEQGKTPHLSNYADGSGYSRFQISNPAQSEVSWTSIATGLNPGGHGMFDFVHRNPKNYGINVSLLPTKQSLVGMQFTPPHTAETIFEHAVTNGYPATSLWWPATFPARLASPVHSIPGLGTPDIGGKLGVGILFTASDLGDSAPDKTEIQKLKSGPNSNTFSGDLFGPAKQKGGQLVPTTMPFTLSFEDENSAKLTLGKKINHTLRIGEWSPVFEISFKMSMLISLKAVTRAILIKGKSEPQLYFLPLQIHPMSSAWPYASPRNFARKTWQDHGPFLTLGWPQDTTGLNEGILIDDQFLSLCDDILYTREQVFMSQLENFHEGVLGIVFDTLDRVQHMFWKNRPDLIEQWYVKLDALIGRIEEKIKSTGNQDAQLLLLSDHGFENFDYKVNLNKWLVDEGFLKTYEPDALSLGNADWYQTRAYALGLNSLYLNLANREGKGQVATDESIQLIELIKNRLLSWKGPDGKQVISSVMTNQEAFDGPISTFGPDLLIGYTPGYRASAETGTGGWNDLQIEENLDHWNGDHCIDPAAVPGVIFSNHSLEGIPNPSYRDIPQLVTGKTMKPGAPPDFDDLTEEDQEVVEDRLKGLGYL